MSNHPNLRSLAMAATPGPWATGAYYNSEGHGVGPFVHDVGQADGDAVVCERAVQEDALYIAAVDPQTILALLDENAALRRDLEEALEIADKFTYRFIGASQGLDMGVSSARERISTLRARSKP